MPRILDDLRKFHREHSHSVGGIERLFVYALLSLRFVSLSYRIRSWLPSARGNRRRIRDNFIDGYCIAQTLTLLGLLSVSPDTLWPVFVAAYVLFELGLVLLNIFFVGKFSELQAQPASIERSILLLLLNLVDVVLIFSVFYRHALGLDATTAVFQSTLVLGTVGYPDKLQFKARLVVSLQIMVDLVLSLLLLSSFVGQLGLFSNRKPRESES